MRSLAIISCVRLREREQKRTEAATREARIDEQQQALRQRGAMLRSLQVRLPTFESHAILHLSTNEYSPLLAAASSDAQLCYLFDLPAIPISDIWQPTGF